MAVINIIFRFFQQYPEIKIEHNFVRPNSAFNQLQNNIFKEFFLLDFIKMNFTKVLNARRCVSNPSFRKKMQSNRNNEIKLDEYADDITALMVADNDEQDMSKLKLLKYSRTHSIVDSYTIRSSSTAVHNGFYCISLQMVWQ